MARGVPDLDGPLSSIASDVRKLRGFVTNFMQERLKDNNSVYYDPVPSELEVRKNEEEEEVISHFLHCCNIALRIQFNNCNLIRTDATAILCCCSFLMVAAPTGRNISDEAHSF